MDDSTNLISHLFEILLSQKDSIHIGTEAQMPIVASIVIGCTIGVLEITMGKLDEETTLDLCGRFIIYRYAKRQYFDTASEASTIVDKHRVGFKDDLLPIRVCALKYVTSDFDERYLDWDVSTAPDRNPKDQTRTSKSEFDEADFKACYDLVITHIDTTFQSISTYHDLITNDKVEACLAFELGIIEYFDRAFLNTGIKDEDLASTRVFNFILYFSREKYGKGSPEISQFFENELRNQAYLQERKHGFDSVNNAHNNRAHFPGKYLLKVLGVD